jgi:hypothetical protein
LPFGPSRSRVSVERISKVLTAAGMSDSRLDMPPSTHAPGVSAPGGITQQAWGQSSQTRRSSGLRVVALLAVVLLVGGTAALAALGVFAPGEPEPVTSARPEGEKSAVPAAAPEPVPEVVPSEPTPPKPEPSASAAADEGGAARADKPEGANNTSVAAPARPSPARPRPAPRPKPEPVATPKPKPKPKPKPTSVPQVDLYQDRK